LTVIVDEPPVLTDVGLKLTVAPAGWPLALNEIVCAAPVSTAVPIVDVPFAPCATEMLLGDAVSAKSDGGAAVTVRLTVAERVAVCPLPVTVMVYVPGVVLAPALTVIVEELPAATVVGLKLIVTPDGCPLALSVTDCAAPDVTAVLTVDAPLPPCCTLRSTGFAAIEKSEAVTVRETAVVCVAPGAAPVSGMV
jgi:hypothetical protein